MELGLILAVIALIASLVIPTVLLLRTQQSAKEDAEKQKEAREAAARAAAAKRAAKAEAKAIAGNPKKKKGGLAKMQKAAAEAAAEEAVGNVAADAYDDDVEEDTGEPKTKKELQKAEKRAAKLQLSFCPSPHAIQLTTKRCQCRDLAAFMVQPPISELATVIARPRRQTRPRSRERSRFARCSAGGGARVHQRATRGDQVLNAHHRPASSRALSPVLLSFVECCRQWGALPVFLVMFA
eukprot:6177384-Pleurochrysis_carterae.AAC.2